ncbi:MAG: CotH kinase family protein, partial [Clostridia bacterium]
MKGTHELGWICLWLLSVSLLGGMGCAYAQTEAEMMADRTETTVTSQWTFEDAKTACPYDAARNMLLYPVVEGQAFPLLSDLHFFDDGGAPISVMALDSQGQSLRAEETVSALLYTQAAYARVNLAVTTLPVLTLTHIGETTVSYQLIDPNHVKHDMQWMSSGVASLEVRGKDPGKMGKRTYDLRLKVRDGANAEKENHRFLGMRNDNHWVLEGMDNDRALLREKLSGDLWNQ